MRTHGRVISFQGACLIIALYILCSCSEPRGIPQWPCEYESFPGTAEFTELIQVTDGIEVYYDFTPSDPTVSMKYLTNDGKHLQFLTWDEHGWHSAFDEAWLASNGISVGSTLPAEYKEIRYGSCSPGLVSFPTITGASGG